MEYTHTHTHHTHTLTGPDDPTYVFDDRGLRVRADSLSKVERTSLSPEVASLKQEQRPKSATTKISVGTFSVG